ncbi:lasso RiPP family leader peptide-containing protein [Micromonospora endophytica]|uniref:lasso RiPP family leader peptide-containing protein n=1 Tax=Micromonospora endophytica TaxID=515350 RepID=UPI000E67CDF7|nr:lasso RiPP family leader peptide-containing protein [Micromonospora endophytica]RIW41649.1 lasso RiPP family leader peptide-containing protein [Micromonospora endophytica]BCJ62915.1 hypothetical protein Jiend_63370 [Micromonospora endophytica]
MHENHDEHLTAATTPDTYQEPTIRRLGTLAELTLGGGDEAFDGTGLSEESLG